MDLIELHTDLLVQTAARGSSCLRAEALVDCRRDVRRVVPHKRKIMHFSRRDARKGQTGYRSSDTAGDSPDESVSWPNCGETNQSDAVEQEGATATDWDSPRQILTVYGALEKDTRPGAKDRTTTSAHQCVFIVYSARQPI